MAKKKSARSTKTRSATKTRTPGQKVAAKLVKQGGPDSIYVGPWLLFRRVAGRNDTKDAVEWIRESIAEAVDVELATSTRRRRTGRASPSS